jgi:hypothetical protein
MDRRDQRRTQAKERNVSDYRTWRTEDIAAEVIRRGLADPHAEWDREQAIDLLRADDEKHAFINFDDESKRILERALRIAIAANHHDITANHIRQAATPNRWAAFTDEELQRLAAATGSINAITLNDEINAERDRRKAT